LNFNGKRTSQAAATTPSKPALLQGMTSQLAEKLNGRGKKCQGTTSVVPQVPQNQRGLQPLRDGFLH